MLGAQRRIEARIGQLLGEAEIGCNQHSGAFPRVGRLKHSVRNRFRILARGFGRKGRYPRGVPTTFAFVSRDLQPFDCAKFPLAGLPRAPYRSSWRSSRSSRASVRSVARCPPL